MRLNIKKIIPSLIVVGFSLIKIQNSHADSPVNTVIYKTPYSSSYYANQNFQNVVFQSISNIQEPHRIKYEIENSIAKSIKQTEESNRNFIKEFTKIKSEFDHYFETNQSEISQLESTYKKLKSENDAKINALEKSAQERFHRLIESHSSLKNSNNKWIELFKQSQTPEAEYVADQLEAEEIDLELQKDGILHDVVTPYTDRVQRFIERSQILKNEIQQSESKTKNLAETLTNRSESVFFDGHLEAGESLQTLAFQVLDIGTQLIPIVSNIRDLIELTSGRNLFTGEELSQFEMNLAAIGTVSILPGKSAVAKVLTKELKALIQTPMGRAAFLKAEQVFLKTQKLLTSDTQRAALARTLQAPSLETLDRLQKTPNLKIVDPVSQNLKRKAEFEKLYPGLKFENEWAEDTIIFSRMTTPGERFVRLIPDNNKWFIEDREFMIILDEWNHLKNQAKQSGTSLENFLKEHLALKEPPKFIAEFELPAGLEILEGVSSNNKFGRGGGWQVFLESKIPKRHPYFVRPIGDL